MPDLIIPEPSSLGGTSNRGTNDAPAVGGGEVDWKGFGSAIKSAPTGSYMATGAAIGAAFGGVGAIVGVAIGAMIESFNLFSRPATEVIGWSKANVGCGPIANKITDDLKVNLSADQFTALRKIIEDRAIGLIQQLETNLTPQAYKARVTRYVGDINSTRGQLDEYTTIRTTLWRFLMQRMEYYAVADVKDKANEEIAYRVRVLVYDWLADQGYMTKQPAAPSFEPSGAGAPGTGVEVASFLSQFSGTAKTLTLFLIVGALFGFAYYWKGAK